MNSDDHEKHLEIHAAILRDLETRTVYRTPPLMRLRNAIILTAAFVFGLAMGTIVGGLL